MDTVADSVLIIEDDRDVAQMIEDRLAREGFEVRWAGDGVRGLSEARRQPPAVILLDITLPGPSGFDVCRELKAVGSTSEIPIIMVTARGDDDYVTMGLELGADDYVQKPFSMKQLVARVHAVLRRARATAARTKKDEIELGVWTLDRKRRGIRRDGREIHFTGVEFEILWFLAGRPGQSASREEIANAILDQRQPKTLRNIDAYVNRIRRRLGPWRGLIATLRNVGYRLDLT